MSLSGETGAESREDEDFRAVLDDLSGGLLMELALYAVINMGAHERLQLVKDETPGQYAICVRNTGINEDLRVDGIPPSLTVPVESVPCAKCAEHVDEKLKLQNRLTMLAMFNAAASKALRGELDLGEER